jgi:hypothetical protein
MLPTKNEHSTQLYGSGLTFFESFFKKYQIVPCELITRITREVPVAACFKTNANELASLKCHSLH